MLWMLHIIPFVKRGSSLADLASLHIVLEIIVMHDIDWRQSSQ